MPDNDWRKYPHTDVTSGVLARRIPWGILITHCGSDEPEKPYPNAPQWDLSIAEMEWLLALARGETDG